MQYAGLRRIGVLALKEGYRVIESAGYRLAPLPGAPLTLLRFVIQSPVTLAAGVLNLSIGSLKTLSSTLQSQRRGRPTEIDYLNGEIVRVGTQVHVPTPYNTRVVELVKEVEKSGQFRSIDEVIRCFPSH
jgi:2-dehydropantoate 2-reductase